MQLVHDRQLGRQGAPRLLVPNAMTVPEAGRIAAELSWAHPLGNSGQSWNSEDGVHATRRACMPWACVARLNTGEPTSWRGGDLV